jgi:hypothetical protein
MKNVFEEVLLLIDLLVTSLRHFLFEVFIFIRQIFKNNIQLLIVFHKSESLSVKLTNFPFGFFLYGMLRLQ